MTQHVTQEQISEWLDGQTSPEQSASVAVHLDSCAACRSIQDEMAAVTRIFKAAEPLQPPSELWSRIARELDAVQPSFSAPPVAGWWQRLVAQPARFWPQIRVAVPAVAVLAVVILAASFTITERNERHRAVAMAAIDHAHELFVAGNLASTNPFSEVPAVSKNNNPFSQTELSKTPNPFSSLASGGGAGVKP